MLSAVVLPRLRALMRLRVLSSFACFVLVAWGAPYASAQKQSATSPNSSETVFSAGGIGTGTRAITGLWQFHLGDDAAWARPGFDDHTWEQIPADQPWGDAGHPAY